VIKHDVVVIGGGLAGMRAAVEAAERGADVAIVSKMHPVRSHSGAAQGGINAALGNREEDSTEAHTFDTVKGSDYLGDQDAVAAMCEDAPKQIIWLEHRGCIFSRLPDGRIAQRPFGGRRNPAYLLLGRRHGFGHPPHTLGATRTLRRQGLRRIFLYVACHRRRHRHGCRPPTTCATASSS